MHVKGPCAQIDSGTFCRGFLLLTISILHSLKALNYGNYGRSIFRIMGNAGFISPTVLGPGFGLSVVEFRAEGVQAQRFYKSRTFSGGSIYLIEAL